MAGTAKELPFSEDVLGFEDVEKSFVCGFVGKFIRGGPICLSEIV
jgi:hypothetical protein